ncbi:hypothetical protein GVN20_05555 [Runella sp. CRIBMP]|uniref:hypothetical protein n=1 Tax=Runella sp. CRIBMP TaxID=2683261 RepID=UPI00141332C8|nr:hypothetical protein [Runella sp. CRIBMP]NBB18816.1 hypothetical protein [Runella sp. CRIBMP]
MKHWFKSEINHEFYLLVELTEVKNADGMPRLEPELKGFIHVRQSRVWYGAAFVPEPRYIAITPTMRVFEAKKAVEAATKNQS